MITEFWQPFREKMREHPYDKTIPMVAADWLDENGFGEQAKMLREDGWNECGLEVLLGQTITNIHMLGQNEDTLEIILSDNTDVRIEAQGDCCSCSWFHRIDGVSNLIGSTILGFTTSETKDVDPEDGLTRQEYDDVYGIGIITTTGCARIVYRCSSNGYYGGWLKVTEDRREMSKQQIQSDWIYK